MRQRDAYCRFAGTCRLSLNLILACSPKQSGSWAVAALLQRIEDIASAENVSLLSPSTVSELSSIFGEPDSVGILHRIADICSEPSPSPTPEQCVLQSIPSQLVSGMAMVIAPLLSSLILAAANQKNSAGGSADVKYKFRWEVLKTCSRIWSLLPDPALPLANFGMRFKQAGSNQAKDALQVVGAARQACPCASHECF